MRRVLLQALAIAVILASVAGTASAASFTPQAEAEYQAALSSWGVTSPALCASVDRELVPEPMAGADQIGEATQPTEPGTTCVLLIADDLPPCVEADVVDHEVGHLLGYGHTATGVMAPVEEAAAACEAEADANEAAALQALHDRCQTARSTWRRVCWRHVRHWRRQAGWLR